MVELEPDHINTLLTRVNVLFMLDKDADVIADCPAYSRTGRDEPFGLVPDGKGEADDFRPLRGYCRPDESDRLERRFHGCLSDDVPGYCCRCSRQPKSLPDVEKAITLAPEEETSYLLRGRIHEAMGNIDAAAADYQNVLELNPFNDEATLLVGQLLITQERLDEAITFFNEAIDLKPDFGKAYAERGRAKNLKGDKDGAFEDLKKSIELNPEGDEARKLEGQHTNFNDMYKGGIF